MNQKRIVFVTGSLADGGAEKVMSILASGCAELGADVTLAVVRDKKIIYTVSDKVKIVQFMDSGRNAIFSRVWRLHKLLENSDADVVIPFLPIISLYTIIANVGVGKKVIMSERADPRARLSYVARKDKIANFLMRKCGLFGLADWMVFQTPDAQAYYSKKIQMKSRIIPNPLDTEKLPVWYDGEREKRVVAAGRFSEEKNFPMLIGAFAQFHKLHPEYTLTIYGEGHLKKTYEEIIKRYGLEGSVSMPGFVSDLPEQMNKAGMYVSTSNHEGISNVMLEALGMGIPTIVTDCPVGGARMFIHTDENGILIPMNDTQALVEAMNHIVQESAYAEKLSVNAVKIREQLSAEKICAKWMELI